MSGRPLDVFLVVGEMSGDQLGFKLMRALREALGGGVMFRGVAGPAMIAEGMESLFPLDDVAVMGIGPVIAHFPTIYRRAWQVINAVVARPPDVLIVIDSPDLTHRIASRVRRRLPKLPIIDYVCPSVWAWRPGRAKTMHRTFDHVLALLPFEPEALARLGGPPCTYVGHPLIERLDELRPDAGEAAQRDSERPTLLVLPGSRSSEVTHHTALFGEAIGLLAQAVPTFDVVLPAVSRHAERLRTMTANWPIKPQIVEGEAAKFAAFRRARAALAASGTVTLELALAGVPMVGAYRGSALEAAIAKRLVKVKTVLLPNLILGEAVIPELLQEAATPEALAAALKPLLVGGAERQTQLTALGRLDALMQLDAETPSQRAARVVLQAIDEKGRCAE